MSIRRPTFRRRPLPDLVIGTPPPMPRPAESAPDSEPAPPPSGMRVVGYRQLSEFVYEVTTESAKHGRVTQNVLVLPESRMNAIDTVTPANPTPDTGPDTVMEAPLP